MPVGDEIFLDHIAHFVSEKDRARNTLTSTGFTAAPFSIQTNREPDGTERLTGTGNTTAMLPRGYLEFLFKPPIRPWAANSMRRTHAMLGFI